MKKSAVVFGFLLSAVFIVSINAGTNRPAQLTPDPGFGSTPLYFVANQGQTDRGVLYYATTPGQTLWLTQGGLVFNQGMAWQGEGAARAAVTFLFKNASPNVQLSAADEADYRVSYFYGRDESEWKTDIPTSRAVLYKNLYDGVDLKVYGVGGDLEYDWVIRPGANPGAVRFGYTGVSGAHIDKHGDLIVTTARGDLRHRKPDAYQILDGKKVDVAASFRSLGDEEYGFAVSAYDPRRELVIDPLIIVSSTYLGGHADDFLPSIAYDASGAVYIAGFTESTDFPPVKVSMPRNDAFVTKLSSDGQSLVYSAFFPAFLSQFGGLVGVAVDGKGSAYLVGHTNSRNFPVKNAFQETRKGPRDAFFLKLTPNGKGLVFSSYLGGSESDYCPHVAVDSTGSFYLSGYTYSSDFPTRKALQKTLSGTEDVFISKFASDGKSLIYSTFLGGHQTEYSSGLAVDGEGAAYICGNTESPQFPLKDAFQKKYGGGGEDGFITKLSPSGDWLIYSSFIGGSSYDLCYGLAVDKTGAVYLTGDTWGSFPLKNALQNTRKGGIEGWIAKVALDGESLNYSTYLGGTNTDIGRKIAVDDNGVAYVVGETESRGFPVKDAFQKTLKGSKDGFLAVVAPDGKSLRLSTFLGGSYRERCADIALSADGGILITGDTNSPDFPLTKPYQNKLAGGDDIFVMKLKLGSD